MGHLDETHGSLSGPEPPIADSPPRSEVPVVRALTDLVTRHVRGRRECHAHALSRRISGTCRRV